MEMPNSPTVMAPTSSHVSFLAADRIPIGTPTRMPMSSVAPVSWSVLTKR